MSKWELLLVTALVEGVTGIALLAAPSLIVELLLGEGLASPQSLVLGRVAGMALVSISVASQLAARGDRSSAETGLVAGMLVYNVGVPVLLLHATLVSRMHGIALW